MNNPEHDKESENFDKPLDKKFLSILNDEKRLWLLKNSHIAKSNYLTIFIIIFFILMTYILNSVDYDVHKFIMSSIKAIIALGLFVFLITFIIHIITKRVVFPMLIMRHIKDNFSLEKTMLVIVTTNIVFYGKTLYLLF